jgi:hypothetical protein
MLQTGSAGSFSTRYPEYMVPDYVPNPCSMYNVLRFVCVLDIWRNLGLTLQRGGGEEGCFSSHDLFSHDLFIGD